jgi:hypothetical protein
MNWDFSQELTNVLSMTVYSAERRERGIWRKMCGEG